MRWVYVFFNTQNPAFKQLLNFENDPFVIRVAFALADNFKLPFSIDDEICIGLQHAKEYWVLYILCNSTYICSTKILLLYWCLPCHSKTQLCLACTLDTRPVFEGHNTYDFLAILNTLETHKDTFCFSTKWPCMWQTCTLICWYGIALQFIPFFCKITKKM